MLTVCDKDMCTGCSACVDLCPRNAISLEDSLSSFNAVINQAQCIDCGACARVCQQNHRLQKLETIACYQGWASDEQIRKKSSSGGAATAIEKYFCEHGGYVCSCRFNQGKFGFSLTNQWGAMNFRGSKYVKSDPHGVYNQIRSLLKNGEKVLFVGLPCQVGAVKNYVGEELLNGLYTIDLICHGTPSPKLLERYLKENHIFLPELTECQFREKERYQLICDNENVGVKSVSDHYTIAFLTGMSYTDNCYRCQYADKTRVSDITLGDSWGTELSKEEQKKGISLILVQTEKGKELVRESELVLTNVDYENTVAHNEQLQRPSTKPDCWEAFFAGVKRGKKLSHLVFKYQPMRCIRQYGRGKLIQLGLRIEK